MYVFIYVTHENSLFMLSHYGCFVYNWCSYSVSKHMLRGNMWLTVWHGGNVICHMSKVILRWAELVLGWLTILLASKLPRYVCNQANYVNSALHSPGSLNWVPALIGWGKGGMSHLCWVESNTVILYGMWVPIVVRHVVKCYIRLLYFRNVSDIWFQFAGYPAF